MNRGSMLEKLIEITKLAGAEAMKFHGDLESTDIETKSDDTPVTKADFAANKIIVEKLKEYFPDIPLLSEESPKEIFDKRKNFIDYFLIDPIDGTKEFIKGSDEFTINIAYIVDHQVKLGVVGLPAKDELYYGSEEGSFVLREGKALKLPLVEYVQEKVRVVSSKSHPNAATDHYVKNLSHFFKQVESLQFGSSLKICKVAEGVADLNPRLGGTSEWDIAAAHAVLLGSGGDILELNTQERVAYNKDDLHNPHYEARRKELLGMKLKL